MKNIDIKSFIIGILGTALIFVTTCATNQNKNLGDITVNSITVVDEKGETVGLLNSFENRGVLSLNKAGKPPMVILICEGTGGSISTYNADGKKISYLGIAEGGAGHVTTYNTDGKKTSYLGSSMDGRGLFVVENNGRIETYNADGKKTSFLGTDDKGGGHLETYNAAGVMTGYFGSNKNKDGMAVLFDRYGDIGWSASGKK